MENANGGASGTSNNAAVREVLSPFVGEVTVEGAAESDTSTAQHHASGVEQRSQSMQQQEMEALAEMEARVGEQEAEPNLFLAVAGGSRGEAGQTADDLCTPAGLLRALAGSLRRLLRTLLDIMAHFVVFITLAHGSWLSAFTVFTGRSPLSPRDAQIFSTSDFLPTLS
jgi:hypothetical protein